MSRPWGLQEWERQAILDAYLGGEKLESIAAEFRISIGYPSMLARRAGKPVRPVGRKTQQTTGRVLTVSIPSAPRQERQTAPR